MPHSRITDEMQAQVQTAIDQVIPETERLSWDVHLGTEEVWVEYDEPVVCEDCGEESHGEYEPTIKVYIVLRFEYPESAQFGLMVLDSPLTEVGSGTIEAMVREGWETAVLQRHEAAMAADLG